jgi:hypothetical protein
MTKWRKNKNCLERSNPLFYCKSSAGGTGEIVVAFILVEAVIKPDENPFIAFTRL